MRMRQWWYVSVAVRLLLAVIPQTGYIHPDEFFQTTEIVAGDVMDIEVYRPWEFNSSYPIRSIVLPHVILGGPIRLQKIIGSYLSYFYSAYFSLLFPRIVMVLLSLTVDLTLYKLCKILKIEERMMFLLSSSSYVMLTFLSRTFTNSFETFLFSVLLYLVYTKFDNYKSFTKRNSKHMLSSSSNSDNVTSVKKKKYWKFKRKQQKIVQENIQEIECIKHGNSTILSVSIGIVTVMGIFNRPTFLMFAFIPLLVWLYLCFMSNRFIRSVTVISFSAVTTFILFVLLDSLYFHPNISGMYTQIDTCMAKEGIADKLSCVLEEVKENLVITPWNFICYNMQTDNLAEHGIHPKYLHFTVNFLMLYGPLYICVIFNFLKNVLNYVKDKNIQLMDFLLMSKLIIPVALLSLFPHQEPRFLIPLLPLVVIISVKFISNSKHWREILTGHVIFNVLLFILFGFLHQGGIIPCLLHIQSGLLSGKYGVHDKFIFYHTYMPPRHLIHSKSANSQIIDMQGKSIEDLQLLLNTIVTKRDSPREVGQNSTVVTEDNIYYIKSNYYLVLPAMIKARVAGEISNFSFSINNQFFYHLSMEDPPAITYLIARFINDLSLSNVFDTYQAFMDQTSLYLLKLNKY